VRFLLDTHTLLWAIGEPGRLSQRATELMIDPRSELLASTASLWEIAIKFQGGKLNVPVSRQYFDFHFSRIGVRRVLAVDQVHVYALLALPPAHRDPFDRLLAAQCIAESAQLITADPIFRKYPIQAVW
jgi:PIN domain nuclease of toxin-antitoxin system